MRLSISALRDELCELFRDGRAIATPIRVLSSDEDLLSPASVPLPIARIRSAILQAVERVGLEVLGSGMRAVVDVVADVLLHSAIHHRALGAKARLPPVLIE